MKARFVWSLVASAGLLFASSVDAAMISEFEPNPPGTDPGTSQVELTGTPGASAAGFLTFIDTDGGSALGAINSSDEVTGVFDANGFLVVTLPFDVENPSFVLVYSTLAPSADVDSDDDDQLDDPSVFGTVFDAIGIIDSSGDATDYATVLGGQEFTEANEFEVAFREGSTGDWYGVDTFTDEVFAIDGTVLSTSAFSPDPETTTYGFANPLLIPEPGAALLAMLGMTFVGAVGMRSKFG